MLPGRVFLESSLFKFPIVWLGPELSQTLKAKFENSIFEASIRIRVFGIPDILNL